MSEMGAALRALRRFARPSGTHDACCDQCGDALVTEHRHLFETRSRTLCCVCRRCAQPSRFDTRWLPVPQRVRAAVGLEISEPHWRALGVPVELAFVGPALDADEAVAVYPGPAGATQTRVPLSAWQAIRTLHPALLDVNSGVEALLANRLDGVQRYYVAPIDVCYQLVGLVRAHFRGLHGGSGLRAELGRFFVALDARAEAVPMCEAGCQQQRGGA